MYTYRIKAVGTTSSPYKTVEVNTTDNITTLAFQEIIKQFIIFPNPSSGTFNVSTPSKLSLLEMHDLSGKVIYKM